MHFFSPSYPANDGSTIKLLSYNRHQAVSTRIYRAMHDTIGQNTYRTTLDFKSRSHVHLLAQTLLNKPPECTRRKLHPLFNFRPEPFLLRPCAAKKGGNETNIRKEPATCRNFQQVHWLCVWRLALFGRLCLTFLYIHDTFIFTNRAKDGKPFCHRVRPYFCPGFVIADRAVYPTVFYHVFSSFNNICHIVNQFYCIFQCLFQNIC